MSWAHQKIEAGHLKSVMGSRLLIYLELPPHIDLHAAMEFFNRVAEIAENEGHHPDLHLENYRDVKVRQTPNI